MSILFGRPAADEYPSHYTPYIDAVPEGDVLDALARQIEQTTAALRVLPDERGTFRYQPGKWSINDVVNHMSDTERVFTYRALRFARSDTTPIPGFDQDEYAAAAGADARELSDLVDEFAAVRQATLALFRSFDPEVLPRRGEANGKPISVRALVYVIAGHERHHLRVLRERYGVT